MRGSIERWQRLSSGLFGHRFFRTIRWDKGPHENIHFFICPFCLVYVFNARWRIISTRTVFVDNFYNYCLDLHRIRFLLCLIALVQESPATPQSIILSVCRPFPSDFLHSWNTSAAIDFLTNLRYNLIISWRVFLNLSNSCQRIVGSSIFKRFNDIKIYKLFWFQTLFLWVPS